MIQLIAAHRELFALGIMVLVLVSLGPTEKLSAQADPAAVAAVTRVKERYEGKLLGIPGVVAVGVGLSDNIAAQPVIEVHVKKATDQLRRALPASLEGVAVKIVETGEIFAY